MSILYVVTSPDGTTIQANGNTIPTGGGSSNDVLSDFVGSTNYIGIAPDGSATSASVWLIKKTVYNSDGSVSSNTSAVDVAWDDRLTETYS